MLNATIYDFNVFVCMCVSVRLHKILYKTMCVRLYESAFM